MELINYIGEVLRDLSNTIKRTTTTQNKKDMSFDGCRKYFIFLKPEMENLTNLLLEMDIFYQF